MLEIVLMYFDELTTTKTWYIDFETYANDGIAYFVDSVKGEEWRVPATWIKSIRAINAED